VRETSAELSLELRVMIEGFVIQTRKH